MYSFEKWIVLSIKRIVFFHVVSAKDVIDYWNDPQSGVVFTDSLRVAGKFIDYFVLLNTSENTSKLSILEISDCSFYLCPIVLSLY